MNATLRNFEAAGYGRNSRREGFSLVELMTVIGVIAVLSSVALMSLAGLTGSRNLNKAAYDIQGVLEQARTTAMASDTYTWVGFFEESPGKPGVTGVGQVVISVVSSADGTNVYGTLSGLTMMPGSSLTQVAKLTKIPNVHLASLPAGSVTRPTVPAVTYQVASGSFANTYSFGYPVSATSAPTYTFTNIIQFNPQGDATRIADTPTQFMEIGLQPAHGSTAVTTSKDVAAVQIAGIGGHVTTYFP